MQAKALLSPAYPRLQIPEQNHRGHLEQPEQRQDPDYDHYAQAASGSACNVMRKVAQRGQEYVNLSVWLHVLRVRMQLEKQMAVLENRVDKAIQRLCGRQAETGRLRDSIDGLRKERLSLNEALAKLEAALAAQRAEAARLLRISQADCVGSDKVAMALLYNPSDPSYVCDALRLPRARFQPIEMPWHCMALLVPLQSLILEPSDDGQSYAVMMTCCGVADTGFGEHSSHEAGRRQGSGQC